MLDLLPSKLFLILLCELARLFVVELGTCFSDCFERPAKLRVLEDVDAACKGQSIAMIEDSARLLHGKRSTVDKGAGGGIRNDDQLE